MFQSCSLYFFCSPTGRPGGISGLEQSYIYQGHKLALKNYYKKTHKTLALNRAAPSDEDETVILSGSASLRDLDKHIEHL